MIKLQPYRNIKLNHWADKSIGTDYLPKLCGAWAKENFDYYIRKRAEYSRQFENVSDFFMS